MNFISQLALVCLWLSPFTIGAQLLLEEDTEINIQAGTYLIANGIDITFKPGSRTTNQGYIVTDQNLLAEGTLFTTVSGITPGTHFGRWTGANSLEVDGTLIAVRDLGYEPVGQTTHKLLNSGNVVGEFATTILPGQNWAFEYNQVNGLLIFDPALPVDWLSFTARVADKDVALSWQTAREVNTDFFAVERLQTPGQWEEIARLAAAGNSEQVVSYRHLDVRPPAGQQLYYRIRQVDLDGVFDYSVTRSVQIGQQEIVAYPNPSPGWIRVIGPELDNTTIKVHNAEGRLVFQTVFAMQTGGMLLELPTQLPSGMYSLRLGDFPAIHFHLSR